MQRLSFGSVYPSAFNLLFIRTLCEKIVRVIIYRLKEIILRVASIVMRHFYKDKTLSQLSLSQFLSLSRSPTHPHPAFSPQSGPSPRFRDLLYLSRVHIPIQETIFSVPLKWHCSFHKNPNGTTLGVIPSSFNLLLFLRITGFFLPVCRVLDSTALVPPRKNFISEPTA